MGRLRRLWLIVLLMMTLLAALPPATRAQMPLAVLAPYIQPGEQVVTLQPALRYHDHLYQIHYFTKGTFNSPNANLIGTASTDIFAQREITGLLITADDQVVEDQTIIREVFRVYRASYYLDQLRSSDSTAFVDTFPFTDFRNDLKWITLNPFFALQMLNRLFDTPTKKKEEAIRAILTVHHPSSSDIDAFSENLSRELAVSRDFGTAVERVLGAMKFANTKDVRMIAADVKKAFASWQVLGEKTTVYVELAGKPVEFANALTLVQFGVKLLWLADMQQDRVQWFRDYMVAFPDGAAGLDNEMRQAFSTVADEVDNDWQQRFNIIEEFVRDQTIDLAKRETTKLLAEAWVKRSWQKYGTRIRGHNAAGAASLVLITITAAQLLYGYDDLYSNFVVAEASDDLRQRFHTARDQLQKQLKSTPVGEYRGDLAVQYGTAYMLENFAAAQAIRAYADGVEATSNRGWLSNINPINWANWARGQDWIAAAKELRQLALDVEQKADLELGSPAFIEPATTLVLDRLSLVKPPLGTCPVDSDQGVSLNEDTTGDPGKVYIVCVNLNDPYLRFETVMANDVRSVNPSPDHRETIASMVSRLPHNQHHPIVALNADYFGQGHGPEGFTVINGLRIDGLYSKDADNNEIKRVSLAFSRTNRVSLGFRSRVEVSDPLLHVSQFFNAVGGGPTLVRDQVWLRDPCPGELFSRNDQCRKVQQTAVGLSPDGQTLVIIAAENRDADEMGRLLISHGASNGMKLDGGGSTQLWHRGDSLITSQRGVANALVIFREEIPRHDAFLMAQSQFPVVEPGAPIELTMTLRNIGFLTWEPRLQYGVQLRRGTSFGLADWQQLPAQIRPNGDVQWKFLSTAPDLPGLYQSEWQLVYRDAGGREDPVGLPVGFVVTVLPKGTSPDVASMWQQLMDQAKEEAKGRLDAIVESVKQELERRAREELRKRIPPALWCLFGLSIIISNSAIVGWRIRKRRYRSDA